MARSFYETLGVPSSASAEEIRSAYRKLVLRYHPDHSSDKRSNEMFLLVTEAYETLGDPDKRHYYDFVQEKDRKLREETKTRAAQAPPDGGRVQSRPRKPTAPEVRAKIEQLSALYRRGQIAAAEELARRILVEDPEQAVVYAILGDLARARGEFPRAAKMYAFAAQFDPQQPEYEIRHVEMLNATARDAVQLEKVKPVGLTALGAGGFVILVCGYYLVPAREGPLLPSVGPISSLTFGLVAMSLIAGLAIGASLGLGGLLDRFSTSAFDSVGKMSTALALGLVAAINFWVAVGLYVAFGFTQRSFQFSASRLLASVGIANIVFGLCAILSPSLNPLQTLLWSGNVLYLASLAGWMVSDAFRKF